MTVLIARLQDYPHLAAICSQWDDAAWPRSPEIEDFFADHYPVAASNQGNDVPQVWIALENDTTPVGMISLIADDHPDYLHLSPWLASAYVLPEYRGQGIFHALQENVVAYVRETLKSSALYVYSHVDFTQWGWVAMEQIVDPFAPEKHVMLFRRDL